MVIGQINIELIPPCKQARFVFFGEEVFNAFSVFRRAVRYGVDANFRPRHNHLVNHLPEVLIGDFTGFNVGQLVFVPAFAFPNDVAQHGQAVKRRQHLRALVTGAYTGVEFFANLLFDNRASTGFNGVAFVQDVFLHPCGKLFFRSGCFHSYQLAA